MKKYIQPAIEVKELELESMICAASATSIPISNADPSEERNLAPSSPNYTVWGADDEE